MNGTATRSADLTVVVRLDLRAAATGPFAVDPAKVGQDTLIGIQNDVVRGHLPGNPAADGRRRFVDVGRVLVVDEAAAFAGHGAAYQHLVLTPTMVKLLCVTVGAFADQAAIDLPGPATGKNAAVLWVGEPNGVGWHLGMTTTTRLAEAGADPGGARTLAELTDTLADPAVFDRVFGAISAMDGKVAAPALLPAVRWPMLDLARLAEEQTAGGGPPGPAEIVLLDIEQLLRDLWSYAPAVARCERLLAEAEAAARWLRRIPGLGGRRAWRAVAALGQACAEVGPVGPLWADARLDAGLADSLRKPRRPLWLWHPAVVLLPLLVLGGAAGAGTAYGIGGQVATADSAGAAVAAVVFSAAAFAWWRYATGRWLSRVRLDDTRAALRKLPFDIARHGVAMLSDAAQAWYRGQQRRLVNWWSVARRAMRGRVIIEVAEVFGLPKPAAPVTAQTIEAAAGDDAPAEISFEDLIASIESVTAAAARLLSASALDDDFLQLTGPRQLPLLDGTPHGTRLVRFAPAVARPALTEVVADAVALNDAVWTQGGEIVGVIRLVPVRPGVARVRGGATTPAEAVIAIQVADGGDGASASLSEWLLADDRLDGRVALPEHGGGPIAVRLPFTTPGNILAAGVIDWLRSADDATGVTFAREDRVESVAATEVRHATDREIEEIVKRVVATIGLP